MTDTQLCLAIGVPVLSNAIMLTLLLAYMNARFARVHQRFDDLDSRWRTELRRVEDLTDARLKHLEER